MVVRLFEARRLVVLHGVGLHHADSRDVLLDEVRHGSERFLRSKAATEETRTDHAGDDDEERIGEDHQRGELHAVSRHRDEGAGEEDRALGDGEEARAEEHADRVEVVHAATHEIARAPLEVERLRLLLEMVVEVVPDLVLDLTGGIEDELTRKEAQ